MFCSGESERMALTLRFQARSLTHLPSQLAAMLASELDQSNPPSPACSASPAEARVGISCLCNHSAVTLHGHICSALSQCGFYQESLTSLDLSLPDAKAMNLSEYLSTQACLSCDAVPPHLPHTPLTYMMFSPYLGISNYEISHAHQQTLLVNQTHQGHVRIAKNNILGMFSYSDGSNAVTHAAGSLFLVSWATVDLQ